MYILKTLDIDNILGMDLNTARMKTERYMKVRNIRRLAVMLPLALFAFCISWHIEKGFGAAFWLWSALFIIAFGNSIWRERRDERMRFRAILKSIGLGK